MAEKLSRQLYSPSLFDTAQDIIGALPLKLVADWLGSEQTYEDALRLLGSHKVTGYSVCSDSAGLTLLTQKKGLLEILAIINQPKTIVYGLGKAIGGEGVGIWAADNTQMFYPDSVDAAMLVSALLTIQDEIAERCQIKIGIGAHFGEYYSLGGGLYGFEADAIEDIAENETEGGEIVISQAIYDRLPPNQGFTVEKRSDLTAGIGTIYRVLDGKRLSDLRPHEQRYPIPYSEDFYTDLIAYAARMQDEEFARRLTDKYLQHKVVVLIDRENQDAQVHEISMFNHLSFSALMKDIGLRLLPAGVAAEIKVAGSLGIYVFDDAAAALGFARAFRQEFEKYEIGCRVGIDAGAVLIFDLPAGGKDIAGNPVNIASKMSQDKGTFGKVYLSAAMKELVDVSGFNEIRYTVSGVEMNVYEG
jgi:class 3 adenylate cyclase